MTAARYLSLYVPARLIANLLKEEIVFASLPQVSGASVRSRRAGSLLL